FRREFRVWPETFDALVSKIQDHPVFGNNSNNAQAPVPIQLAVALYRFGHYGNAASQLSISYWAGVSLGSVPLYTARVMTAILGVGLLKEYVRMPNEEEKEKAKAAVIRMSGCKEWGGGWCMVDGTLIPIYARPNWYGVSYFDRKMNYSMSLQV
ncbi:hypothetical protein FB45DRAFT_690921, partial [Roridomyces roridus]